MPFVPFINKELNIIPEDQMPREISCGRYQSGICLECFCNECNKSGHVTWKDPSGDLHSVRCKCDRIAMQKKKIKDSGLSAWLDRYTFEEYQPSSEAEKNVLNAARAYAGLGFYKRNSFFISGCPGSGKTHICAAIAISLIEKGKSVKIFQWISDSVKLKSAIMDHEEYQKLIDPILNVDLLFIDDLFKVNPTDADRRLAMDILNKRYNSGKPCIISSERSIQEIRKFDPAISGRISEMCGSYMITSPGIDRRQIKAV